MLDSSHERGWLRSVIFVKPAMALAFGILAFLEFGNANGPVEKIVGAIGISGLSAALLAGFASAAMVWVSQGRKHRDAAAAETAIRLGLTAASFESFWHDTTDGLFSVDVDEAGRFTFAGINPAHERLTGLRTTDLIGSTPEACLKPEVAAAASAHYRECIQRGRPLAYDEALDLPSGVRHWRTNLVPIRHPRTGRIVQLMGSARDVTVDRAAHDDLHRSNERLQSVVSSISDCYCILDSDWRLTFANPAALRWAGKTLKDVFGKSYRDVYTADTLTGRVVIEAMEGRKVVHEELPSATKPGRWLKYNLYPTPDGGLAVVFRDITEIREAREALNNLPRQILASQENERRRIASELHDSTIQHIVAANLNLMRLCAPGSDADPSACDDIQRSLDEALQELRVFTYLLHPPALHRDGLVATLGTFLDGFGRRAGLEVSVRASPELDQLSDDLQHAIFRVVQEALSNTHRHARASHVRVQAQLVRGTLFVRVSDNGCGISARKDRSSQVDSAPVGVGLRGMRARLEQFGGQLRVRNTGVQRSGTAVVAMVPKARHARSLLGRTGEPYSTTRPQPPATGDQRRFA